MRHIYLAQMGKARPVLVLTAEERRQVLRNVTVAPITSTIRGAVSEVEVGPANGLDHVCVINCDDIQTIPATDLGRHVGTLFDDQEAALTTALSRAFDLWDSDSD